MTREQFEHAIRASGAVLGADAVLVVGSQALHATVQARRGRGSALDELSGRGA